MSNIRTGAERMLHDLSHRGFLAGQIGRFITISTTPGIAGDSFEMDAVGALRLSPLFFFSGRRRHTRLTCDWSSDVCSSDLRPVAAAGELGQSMLEDAKKHADEMAKEAQTGLDAAKKEFDEKGGAAEKVISDIVDKTKAKVEGAMKALEDLTKHATQAAESALKRDKAAVEKSVQEAEAVVKQCQDAYDEAVAKLKELTEKVPQKANVVGQPLVDQAQKALETAKTLLDHAKQALEEAGKDGLADAKSTQKQVEEFFAKVWDEAKKQLENIAKEMKEKIVQAIDRLLKKVEDEVMKGAEKVLAKALETATHSWDLKETESAAGDEATKQLKEIMKQALEDAKVELNKLYEDFKGVAQKAGTEMLTHLVMGTDAAAGSADQSVEAAGEVQNNPVKQSDEHTKTAEARHDELSKAHDAEKDKHEEQTKKFLGQLKEQYGKVHEMGQPMQGPLQESLKKSGVSIDKSSSILMSQARGAVDQISAEYEGAKKAYDEAKAHSSSLKELTSRIPEIRSHVDEAFNHLKSAYDEGNK